MAVVRTLISVYNLGDREGIMSRAKKAVVGVIAAIVVLGVLIGVYFAICAAGCDHLYGYIEGRYAPVDYGDDFARAEYYFDEEDGCYAFVKPDGRDFKVLQLTDTHIGGGVFCKGKDEQALDAVYDMINGVKPDLVVFTGDVLYPFPFQSGNTDNETTARQFMEFMDATGVPWTLIFGNHDSESTSKLDRYGLAELFAENKEDKCLFTVNPKDTEIDGCGNQVIKILNSDGTLNNLLFLFDSHSTLKGKPLKYDCIKESQVVWYEETVKKYSAPEYGFADGGVVPSVAYIHIPLTEYAEAWELYNSGSGEVTYVRGTCDEKILSPYVSEKYPKSRLFEAMTELGSTKAIYCGHNHMNDFTAIYKGIKLSFSKSIVYLGLHGIHKTDAYRGGTLVTFGADGTYADASISITEVRG